MSWLVCALLSAITAAFIAIFGKAGLGGVDSVVASGIRAGIMFVVIALTGKLPVAMSIDRSSLLYIGLGGLAGAASWIFYFLALQSWKGSSVAPIDRLSVAFVIVLAALFLGEQIPPKIAVGTFLIVVVAIIIALA